MKIIDKLALQSRVNGLLLFRDGLFLKSYNQSTYILTELLGQNLKIKCYQVKCLNNQMVIECAFPYSKLTHRLPMAVETAFGARLSEQFNLEGYDKWYERCCRSSNVVERVAKAEVRPLQTVSPSAASLMQNTVNTTSVLLPLFRQQFAYLQTWQKGLYPHEVDLGFIESLKQQIRLLC